MFILEWGRKLQKSDPNSHFSIRQKAAENAAIIFILALERKPKKKKKKKMRP